MVPVNTQTSRMAAARAIVVVVASVLAGLMAGWLVITLHGPSEDELQRAVMDEIGLPPELESSPLLGSALDRYTERMKARVIAESRPSAVAAIAAGTAITACVLSLGKVIAGRSTADLCGDHHCPTSD